MRVLVSAFGTIGDFYPMLSVAKAMRNRNHEVILLANPAYAARTRHAGIEFYPVGREQDLQKIKRDPHVWSYRLGWLKWLMGAGIEPMVELCQAIERLNDPGRTAIAAHYLSLGARAAQEKFGIPSATFHLNVHTIRTVHDVHAYPPPGFLPDMLPRSYLLPQWMPVFYRTASLNVAEILYINRKLAGRVNRHRRQLGLPPLRSFVRVWWNSPDLIIGMFPNWWTGDHPDWPPQVVLTGFPITTEPDDSSWSPSLETFVGSDRRLWVMTPGASANHTERHFSAFAEACRAADTRGLIITHHDPPASIRNSHIRFERFVPFARLFQRSGLVLHHAGIGTSAHAMAAGIPQLVSPTLYNEPDTAVRLKRLGIARELSSRRFTGKAILKHARQLLESAEVRSRCAEIAGKMQETETIPQICDQLENLVPPAGDG